MLIGDAAHTMLPFSGQGANLAIEESQLLGEFFKNASTAEVPAEVRRFEATRRKRIVTIKLLSRIRFGKENDAAYRLLEHDELDSAEIPRSFHERLLFEWKNDSYGEVEKLEID
ncbi:hypothetical protein DM02DRAFT_669566 [Periconia macrospinosa]|uniref:FAD-binding domain-containing protein n=1 Tax=Periconia macrospinosa TaxID=97972 RepID=A0A2V1E0K1_9PLEO|nr:hypothetical protein DM02DRAFT_669566 [Periconia macrospinosa]